MGRQNVRLPALALASVVVVAFALFALTLRPGPVSAQEMVCARGDFVAVVDDAAAALRDLNATNKAKFQTRLRDLKTKNGWSQDEYVKAAEPYVRDPTIIEFDQTSAKLLAEIAALGQEGSNAASPDCAVLLQLRGRMNILVRTQEDKWAYMFAKIDKALTD